jgi:hypothetical protein
MKTSTLLFGLLAGIALFACEVEPVADPVDASTPPDRGHGKADGPLTGSCFEGDVNACGGPAPTGNCWCDELCDSYGDCCADKHDICDGGGPVLCLADEQCGAGQVCDHTECLSGCSGDAICPAVCYGQCVEAPADCNINVQTVLCGPGTLFDPATCACVPVQCSTLGEADCDLRSDCEWVTVPGLTGPMSWCQPVEPPPACEAPAGYTAIGSAEFFADPLAFSGQQVALSGPAMIGPSACTKIGCPDTDPCCNACFAGLSLTNPEGQIELSGMDCSGNECNVADSCTVPPGTDVIVWGVATEVVGTVHLEVHGHCE